MPTRSHFAGWQSYGQERPPFAVAPGPGQESVWDYPRPPLIDTDAREVIVRVSNMVVAHTRSALRVLETASPPTFYIPRVDIAAEYLQPAPGAWYCEWKGAAQLLECPGATGRARCGRLVLRGPADRVRSASRSSLLLPVAN